MIQKDKCNFIEFAGQTYEALFSTADNNKSYSINDEKLQDKFDLLCDELKIDDICYLKQIHSDKVLICDKNSIFHGNYEGDAIITKLKNTAVGVFTADCVPVLLVDAEKKVAAAVHSGWRGTIANIVGKTINKMNKDFGCELESIKVFIGPHNKECCYEVSEELIEEFKNNELFKNANINNARYLSLENCIVHEAEKIGIDKNNIVISSYCTFCSDNVKFHSYRKSGKAAGRQFSMIYLK